MPKAQQITFDLNHGDNRFRWRAYFDAFQIERSEEGVLLYFAFNGLMRGSQPSIATVFLDHQSLKRVFESSKKYFESMGIPSNRTKRELPNGKVHSPEFANHITLAHSQGIGELGFYTILIHDLATIIRRSKSSKDRLVATTLPVAVFHAKFETYQHFLTELFSEVKLK